MNKKKVLLILSRMPYPPTSGDSVKSYNLIKILSKHFDISLVVLTDSAPLDEQLNFCNLYCNKVKVFEKPKYQSYLNTLKSLFNGKPLQVNYYYFKDVQAYIDREIKSTDIVINTLVRTSEYVLSSKKPKYLDMVDSIAMNYKRSKEKANSFFWRFIYNVESKRLSHYEHKCVAVYNNTFLVNKFESQQLSYYGNTKWIPNGVNEDLFNYKLTDNTYKNSIAFFGRMDYQPNIDAVFWFVENILPNLNKSIDFVIVGSHPTNRITNLQNDRIKVTGFLEDPFVILNSCFAIVAPMQTGGGIQNKILESMALGKIVVTNTLGSSPIEGAINFQHLISEDNEVRYANYINDIYLNYNEFQYIGNNAKKFIKENFTWSSYETMLIEMLEDNLND